MNINIQTIPHSAQRYNTCGDWWWNDDTHLEIRVSEMGDWRYEMLVAFHELYEVLVCRHKGISQESVDEFDKAFEKIREAYPNIIGDMEPGNMSSAPYNKQHEGATHVERLLAIELGVDWNKYDKSVNKLC